VEKIDVKKEKPKKSQVESIKKEMERLNSMYRKDRITEEVYDRDYLELENKLRVAEIEEESTKNEKDVSHLKELVNSDWRSVYDQFDRQHKKVFWRKIIKKFSVTMDKKINEESIIFF
jgi:phage shock protein A